MATEVPCPKCGKKHAISDSDLRTNRKLDIPCSCGSTLNISNDVPDALSKITQDFKNILR